LAEKSLQEALDDFIAASKSASASLMKTVEDMESRRCPHGRYFICAICALEKVIEGNEID
jgi:hypothetical protein